MFVLKMSMVELSKRASLAQPLFYCLLFCFFTFSSGELFHVVWGIFKPKLGHLVAVMLLGWFASNRKVWRMPQPLMRAFLFILGSFILSAVIGAAPIRSFGYIGVYLFNFLVYFLLPFQIIQMMDLSRFFRIYWSSFLLVGFYAVVQVMLSIFEVYDLLATQRIGSITRGQAWTYEPSYYALYMVPYVMYHNGKAFFQKAQPFKLFCQNMMLALSTSTGLIVSYPAFYVCYLMKFMNPFRGAIKHKLKKALVAFVVILATGTLLFYEIMFQSLFKFFLFGLDGHISFLARWEGIVASVQTFLRHPIFGMGLGGVSAERFAEASAYDTKMVTLQEFEAYDPTNCLTEVMASLGLVGLTTFIYLGIVFYRAFQEVIKGTFIDTETKQEAIALFISLVVMIIALQMNQGLFRPYVWIHAAVVYGYLRKVRAESLSKLHHVDRLF